MPKLLESEDTFTDCNKEKADELRVKITEFLGDDAKLLSLYTTCLQTYYETIRDKECSYC